MKLKNRITFGSVAPMILVVIVSVVTIGAISALIDQSERVAHRAEVIKRSNEVLGAALGMETGVRGYLLAGQEEL